MTEDRENQQTTCLISVKGLPGVRVSKFSRQTEQVKKWKGLLRVSENWKNQQTTCLISAKGLPKVGISKFPRQTEQVKKWEGLLQFAKHPPNLPRQIRGGCYFILM